LPPTPLGAERPRRVLVSDEHHACPRSTAQTDPPRLVAGLVMRIRRIVHGQIVPVWTPAGWQHAEAPARLTVVKVRSAGISAMCVAALALSACTGSGDTKSTQHPSSSSAPRPTAYQICQSAAGSDESVVAAHLTTVDQVRGRRGGPRPADPSQAEKPWADLPGDDAAAWCTFHSGSGYIVAATTAGHPRVGFMVTDTMFDPGTQGPAIP
jgi:hypothetical protein